MASGCISSCVDDIRLPVRATYVNIYKWPESDAEFVKTVSAANVHKGAHRGNNCPRVVDSISCRQMYLRSYTFSKKETVQEKTKKCFGRVKEKVVHRKKEEKMISSDGGGSNCRRKYVVIRKVKEISIAALVSIFHRLLTCTSSVDVVDHGRG